MKLPPVVRAEVEKRFPAELVSRLAVELESLVLPILDEKGNERYRARVLLAIVKYADGKPERFDLALREARSDWRDVLVMAGLADADWPEVLRRSGYGVPPE